MLAVLLCLIPKPENDLFFELRTGTDILLAGRLPHADLYSWTRHGTRWDVPEWGAFVLYAAAFRAARFFGTWLMMAALTVAAAAIVWYRLTRYVGLAVAGALSALMLLALSPCLQERPYAFTYPMMAVGLILLAQGRAGHPRALLWLLPLCVVWTNLHQGVLAFVGLILACGAGDGLTAFIRRFHDARTAPDLLTPEGRAQAERRETDPDGSRAHAGRAFLMLGTAAACAGAALISPYGWGVYRSVAITLGDRVMMARVTEWKPITVLPASQLPPFVLVVLVTFGALVLSRRRLLAELLMLLGLLAEAVLHARHTALFAVAATVIVAPHLPPAAERLRQHRSTLPPSVLRAPLLAVLALLGFLVATGATLAGLRRAAGPHLLTPEGIGEAVAELPSYPTAACAFMDREDFPTDLHLLNNFEIGGYLMWRRPQQPVFIDGRLDLYTGRIFVDTLALTHTPASPQGRFLIHKYDLDALLTTDRRQAREFAALADWQIVYADPPGPHSAHAHLFLRRCPRFAALFARCRR